MILSSEPLGRVPDASSRKLPTAPATLVVTSFPHIMPIRPDCHRLKPDDQSLITRKSVHNDASRCSPGTCYICNGWDYGLQMCYSCSSLVCRLCKPNPQGCCLQCEMTFPRGYLVAPADQQIFRRPETCASTRRVQGTDSQDGKLAQMASITPHRKPVQMASFAPQVGLNLSTEANNIQNASTPSSKDEIPTTAMMIRNIPCRFLHDDIVEILHEAGFDGEYDLVHVPRRKNQKSNLGYAFVHFKDKAAASRFSSIFNGYQFAGTKSNKICEVSLAHFQGTLPQSTDDYYSISWTNGTNSGHE